MDKKYVYEVKKILVNEFNINNFKLVTNEYNWTSLYYKDEVF